MSPQPDNIQRAVDDQYNFLNSPVYISCHVMHPQLAWISLRIAGKSCEEKNKTFTSPRLGKVRTSGLSLDGQPIVSFEQDWQRAE